MFLWTKDLKVEAKAKIMNLKPKAKAKDTVNYRLHL